MGSSSKRHSLFGVNNYRYLLMTSLIHAVHILPVGIAQSTDEQALLAFKIAISGDPSGVLAA
jgi:hypothetical protein